MIQTLVFITRTFLQVQLALSVGTGKTNLDHAHKPKNLPVISEVGSR